MKVESIFADALEKPSTAERQAFLDEACGGDVALRRRVERLLAVHEHDGGILERGPDTAVFGPPHLEPSLDQDRLFAGRFKLREKLGVGGMGEVWVADQVGPVQRRVALKVVKPGLDSARMLARFDQERQALAMMDHPNIAKVFDAGSTEVRGQGSGIRSQESVVRDQGSGGDVLIPDSCLLTPDTGCPYFVMELIKGVPITKYCDQARLSPRQRLELFIPVCHAVQHAHQKGIIHRDLKPSNILVALYDGLAVPKVIDFGVAKATGPRLTEQSIYTEVGAFIGTLEYMAPEQAKLNNLDIDTRADIYALGAVLYELLTGSLPFSRQELEAAEFLEMLRMIKEVEPPKPSTRLSSSETLPNVAESRHMEPKQLISLVRGELDWIVVKCLEKDRSRRYETASGLALDLQRYLANEPVDACPPSASYRLRKFASKHKSVLGTAAAFVALLVAGVIVSSWLAVGATLAEGQAHTEREAARLAEKQAEDRFELAKTSVDKYLNAITFDPDLNHRDFNKLRKRLMETSLPFYQKLAEQAGGTPKAEAARGYAYHRLAYLRREMGETEAALADCAQVQTIFTKLAADFPEVQSYRQFLGVGRNEQSLLLRRLGRRDEAETVSSEAITILEKLVVEKPSVQEYRKDLAFGRLLLSAVQGDLGKRDKAEVNLRAGIGIYEQLRTESDDPAYGFELSQAHCDLGGHLSAMGKPAEAESAFRSALAIQQELVTKFPTNPAYQSVLARTHNTLGTHLRAGKAAADEFRAALKIRERLAVEFPTIPLYRLQLADTHNNLGLALVSLEILTEAETAYRAALDIQEKLAADSPKEHARAVALAGTYVNMGDLVQKQGRAEGSLDWYAKGVSILSSVLANDNRLGHVRLFLRNAHWGRAEALQELGRHPDAVKDWDRAIELNDYKQMKSSFEKSRMKSRALGGELIDLGSRLLKEDKPAEAETILRECLAILQQQQPDAWPTFNTQSLLGSALLAQGKHAEAEPQLLSGYEGLKRREARIPASSKVSLAEALARLVQLHEATDKQDEAAKWRKELEATKANLK